MRKYILRSIFLGAMLVFTSSWVSEAGESPVTPSHLRIIESLFRTNGLGEATAGIDKSGRVELGGGYKDSREVSLAFSLAQSVVGVKWTSSVTPENIKVRKWAEELSSLFPTKKNKEESTLVQPSVGDGIREKYALVVGIGRFKYDKNGKATLRYAVTDARKVYDYLVDIKYGNFKKENVILLTDEDATVGNVQQALNGINNKTDSDDEVFIYFSTHGIEVFDGSMNIVTYETVLSSKRLEAMESSFPSKSLKDFLFEIKGESVVVVLDTCYSGAAFKDIDGFYYAGSKSINFDDDNQGLSKAAMAKTLLGSKDIVFEDDAIKTHEETTGKGVKVIMSASDAGEKSWELDSLKAGVFTHYFLRELRKGTTVKTAFEEAKPMVTTQVKQEREANQNPQIIASKKEWEIKIASK